MFSNYERRLLGDKYFIFIREEEKFIEVMSKPTSHCWMVFKKESKVDKPITLYHKHTRGTEYYHKQRDVYTVKQAIDTIKQHDNYVLKGE